MSKPLKPGCLALVVGCKVVPENNGKVVKLVALETNRTRSYEDGTRTRTVGTAWWAERAERDLGLRNFHDKAQVMRVPARYFKPSNLIRIDADPTDIQEVEHVEAD